MAAQYSKRQRLSCLLLLLSLWEYALLLPWSLDNAAALEPALIARSSCQATTASRNKLFPVWQSTVCILLSHLRPCEAVLHIYAMIST